MIDEISTTSLQLRADLLLIMNRNKRRQIIALNIVSLCILQMLLIYSEVLVVKI